MQGLTNGTPPASLDDLPGFNGLVEPRQEPGVLEGELRRKQPPPPNSCIVLKNLDYDIRTPELLKIITEIAGGRKSFVNVTLVDDKNTKTFRGMAFVNFHCVEDAQRHLPALTNLRVNNRRVYAEFRRLRPGERPKGGHGQGHGHFGGSPGAAGGPGPAIARGYGKSYGSADFSGKRSTFEDDVVVGAVDENGKEIDKRANFFKTRDIGRKGEGSTKFANMKEKDSKTNKERELEADFRRQLEQYRDSTAGDDGDDGDMCFDQDLTSFERRIVHVLCDELGLGHVSRAVDDGARRVLFVTRDPARIAEWEIETADARKAAAEKAQEKAVAAQEKKRERQAEKAERAARASTEGGVVGGGNSGPSCSMVPGAPTEQERKGIKWFRPKCAQDQGGEAIAKPVFKVYVPSRQPTGPDGSIGFRRRNPDADIAEEEAAGEVEQIEGQTINGHMSSPGNLIIEATDSASVANNGAPVGLATSGVRKITLNPDVPPFEFVSNV